MKIQLSSDALADLEEGFDFYQQQAPGLGSYFIASLTADIEALNYFGGVHQIAHGYYRALSRRFPFCIYYFVEADDLIVVAVIDARRNPLWTRQRLSKD
jgi:plasmid stabilization system protein ParE